ncbi:HAD family hydrolase [Paraburkholderia caribensis]|uniref:HAD family hydrolase n=1 Tax=Paraburkholderia caribensis TaxID=75105 RepID=UPI001CB49550|nr:hydrolase [Paraburkholderia caribensis]CAG9193825.1 Hydrolase [Paraburkholderia caribensis]
MKSLPRLLQEAQSALLCVDAFDTLLLRKPVSLEQRLLKVAKLFCERLALRPSELAPYALARRRRQVEQIAYRARNVAGRGEVRLESIASSLLELVHIDTAYVPEWIACELAVERECLVPNLPLIRVLERLHASGVSLRVVSDTSLSGDALRQLITAVCPPGLQWDAVHTSADLQLTKRDGTIFAAVSDVAGVPLSKMAHLGDDLVADCTMPRRCGMTAILRPRSRLHVAMLRANAVLARGQSQWHRWRHREAQKRAKGGGSRTAGDTLVPDVLGPVFAEYCRRLHVYLEQTAAIEGPIVALFCARGGLGLERLYERYTAQFPARGDISIQPLMISRLVAARDAFVYGGEGVVDELDYSFEVRNVSALARALTGADMAPNGNYATVREFVEGLRSGREPHLHEQIVEQAGRFREVWRTITAGMQGIVLCDTGLYGSTFKMLMQSKLIDRGHCVQLARSDYKHLGREHFPSVTGLLTERNGYKPGDSISSVLAFWHLIESLVEPDLESVRRFDRRADGSLVSNLESEGWQQKLVSMPDPKFEEIADYVAQSAKRPAADTSLAEFELAAKTLERVIMFPDPELVNRLAERDRSLDYGRDDTVKVTGPNLRQASAWTRLFVAKQSLWPSGAVVRAFPHSHRLVQKTIRLGYTVRSWIR